MKPYLTLQSSEQIIVTAAASIYAADIRVPGQD